MDDQQKVFAGLGLLVIAIVIAAIALSGDSDNGGNGEEPAPPPPATDFACGLGASAVGLIAAGLNRGRSSGQIIAEVGGSAAVGYGCREAIKTLVNRPEEPVDLEIETNSGTVDTTATGEELAAPPPPPEEAPQSAPPSCFDWESLILFRMCIDGTLPPPSQ